MSALSLRLISTAVLNIHSEGPGVMTPLNSERGQTPYRRSGLQEIDLPFLDIAR